MELKKIAIETLETEFRRMADFYVEQLRKECEEKIEQAREAAKQLAWVTGLTLPDLFGQASHVMVADRFRSHPSCYQEDVELRSVAGFEMRARVRLETNGDDGPKGKYRVVLLIVPLEGK